MGFDGSGTIRELADQLERDLVVRPGNQSGFTVFSDDPIDKELDHALHPDEKVNSLLKRRNKKHFLKLPRLKKKGD